ncbi:MAG: glycosyltransferase family 2 protein [Nitrospinota bacterium]
MKGEPKKRGGGQGPRVCVLVLNWNGREDTIECLHSLESVEYLDLEILLVDNGSVDGSVKMVREKFPDLSILETGKNLGYAAGNNRGITYAFSRGARYVILLNNDTVVDPNFVKELVLVAESTPGAGLLSSKVFFYDRPEALWFAGGTFSLFTGRSTHFGYNEPDDGRFDEVIEIERACGCAMMVSAEYCEAVGLLNEEYFCYCEETDWSLRGKKAGYRALFVPKSVVFHKVSRATGGTLSGSYLYYVVRNTLKCLKDNSPGWFNAVRGFVVIAVYFLSLFTMSIPKLRGAQNIFFGARDFYLNRFGERGGEV